jgi:hypothetical protein
MFLPRAPLLAGSKHGLYSRRTGNVPSRRAFSFRTLPKKEASMGSSLRNGAIALGFLAGVALAGAAEDVNTGQASPDADTGVAAGGPIGATGQTMPAKFSAENDALDKMPIMGHPLPLTDAQKRMVYDSLAANSEAETRGITVGPANALPADVAIHGLPEKLTDQVPALKGYKFVKLIDKIVIVSPPNRIVVGEIAK